MQAPAAIANPAEYGPAVRVEQDGFPDSEIAAIRALPRFTEACRQAALSGLAHYRGNRLANAVVNDRGRSAIVFLALYLDRTRQPDDPGLTLGRLKAICADQDIGSPGRIEAFVLMLRVFGLLKQVPNAVDQRVRRLVPTERLVLLLHERWFGLLGAMAHVLPEAETIRAAFDNDAFERAMIRRMGERFLAGIRPLKDARARELFGDRNAGLVIAFALMTAGGPDDFPPRNPARISISGLARQFGVSRVHVRTLLRDAAAAGYIAGSDQRNAGIIVRPPLQDAVETFFASAFLYMRDCAQGAFDEVKAKRGDTPIHRAVARAGNG